MGLGGKYLYTIPPDLQKFKSGTEMPVPVLPFYSRIANAYEDQRQGQYAVQYEGRLSSTNGEIKAISRTTGNLVYNNAIPASPTNRVTSAGNDILTADAVAGSGTEGPSSTVGYYLRILSGGCGRGNQKNYRHPYRWLWNLTLLGPQEKFRNQMTCTKSGLVLK